jgi:hypothetical protein
VIGPFVLSNLSAKNENKGKAKVRVDNVLAHQQCAFDHSLILPEQRIALVFGGCQLSNRH